MAEQLTVSGGTKQERYETLLPQLAALVEAEDDIIADMANISACLKDTFGFWWTGFYRVQPSATAPEGEELVLGPFQGPLACTRIRKGRGVWGTAWERAETVIVPDVDRFPGHIACSSASRSEIVVPVVSGGKVTAVLDIDSERLNTFDDTDKTWLEKVAALLA